MEPFRIPEPLRNLTYPYPDPSLVLDAAGQAERVNNFETLW